MQHPNDHRPMSAVSVSFVHIIRNELKHLELPPRSSPNARDKGVIYLELSWNLTCLHRNGRYVCEPEVLGVIGQFGSEKTPILRLFFFNMYHVQNRQYSDAYVPIVARNRLGRR